MTSESSPRLVADDSPTPAALPAMHNVLVVDDSTVDRHLAGGLIQKMDGWKASFAGNGVEALAAMAEHMPDIVLTDMLMPEMDGLELVQTMRIKYPRVPVILMTAHGSEDVAIQALRKGAASYVPKKSLARDLPDTLDQVLAATQTDRNSRRIVDCLMRQETHFVLQNDSSLIAPLVGYLEDTLARIQLCEPGGLLLLGVALHEALTNAIFHGNLELSSDLKEKDEKQFYRLAEERKKQSPYKDRRVFVATTLTRQEATFVVRDQGTGFDPATLPDPADPSNLDRISGRGLLLIQTFMDRVEHNETGNQITMIKYRG
jgi:CheY-like chemotaxis protein/anti-sigma regulatory factor (Ser/Thr protein kinase)